ncbi:MAG: hypothetical protein ACLRXI_08295 [Clostridia bacterium]|jgi:hypothetical protein
MKKTAISLLICGLILGSQTNAYAYQSQTQVEKNITNIEEQSNEIKFYDTPQETIDKMNKNFEESKKENNYLEENNYFQSRISFSSKMAKVLYEAGFTHSGEMLNYSMLKVREEPLEYYADSLMSVDIWTYSPEFRTVVTSFLQEARSKKSYSYYKTTSMTFKETGASKIDILNNRALKKRTDLFGSLHRVNINLGVVKNGVKWNILVLIEDKYDFGKEEYEGLVDLVNNIAYYEQELGEIIPYKVQIFADKPNLITLPFNVPIW